MKHYCARYKKRYTKGQVSADHCKDCPIKSCRIEFPITRRKITHVTF